jgi:Putative adhesin
MTSWRGGPTLGSMHIGWIVPFAALVIAACGPGYVGKVNVSVESASFTEPVTRVVFELSSGDLSVRPARGTAVEITRGLHWRGDKPPVYTETREGQTLRVTYRCPIINCWIDYEVGLPDMVEVDVRSASGDVLVTDLAAPVKVELSSGDVQLSRVKGTVTVNTSSGDVSGTDLAGTRAEVTASSGEVNLDFAVAPQSVRVDVASGDITVLVPPDREPYLVEVTTTSGEDRVTVDRSQSAARRIEAESSSGDVTIGYGRARSAGTPSPS